MNKKLTLLLITLLSTFQAHADSEKNWFVGGLYSVQDISFAPDREPKTIGIVGGYRTSEHFSVEARFHASVSLKMTLVKSRSRQKSPESRPKSRLNT